MAQWMIAGTDTGVGKTVLTACLAAYWQQYRQGRVSIVKPVQCGLGDGEFYRDLFGDSLDVEVPEVFEAAIAPPLAAALEGRSVDLGRLWESFAAARASHPLVLVEGVGALGCPLTWETTLADLASDWHLSVLLVAPVRLGVIGQLVATVGYARSLGLDVRGIILSQTEPVAGDLAALASVPLIENLCRLPVLGTLPHITDLTHRATLAVACSQLWLEPLGLGVALPGAYTLP